MIKIGYQGIIGSYSYQASLNFIKKLNIKNVQLIALVNSRNVVNSLINKEIDYGVVAISNTTAGEVLETKEALKDKSLFLIDYQDLKIEHCLFIKEDINKNNIKRIVSHEQALSQTKNTCKKVFPKVKLFPYEDTALAAKDLANNILDKHDAVICSKSAGEYYNLKLVYQGLNDNANNYTKFVIYKNI